MAVARANWKGYLRLSLVSCPVALYPATSDEKKISLNRINRATGNRLRQQNIDEVTKEVIAGDDVGKAYQLDKETRIPIEDDELEAIELESKRTIQIDQPDLDVAVQFLGYREDVPSCWRAPACTAVRAGPNIAKDSASSCSKRKWPGCRRW